jgi:SAM-dependent methyltransferase
MQNNKQDHIIVKPYTKTSKYFESLIGTTDVEKECDDLEDIFKKYKVKNVLDFGCGTGLHSIELGRRYYNITGIDISKEMIDIATSKTDSNYATLINTSISDFNNKILYDSCISMWNVIGYILSKEELTSTFKEIRNRLKNNGVFIFDCFNGIAVFKVGPQVTYKECKIDREKIIKIGIPFLEPLLQILDVKFKYFIFKNNKFKEEIDEIHRMRIYMPWEIEECLGRAGFELEKITSIENYPKEAKDIEWDIRYIARAV